MAENINRSETQNLVQDKKGKAPLSEEKKTLGDKINERIPSVSADTYRFAVLLFIGFSVFLSVVRIFTIEKSVKFPGFTGANSTYELENTIFTKTFMVLYIIGILSSVALGILSHKVPFSASKRSNPFVFISSLAGFCMVGCAGFFIYRSTLFSTPVTKLGYWVIILMLFTGMYFAMDAVGFIGEKLRPIFSIGVVFFCIVRLAYEFITLHEFQECSSNEYHLLGLVFLLLFFSCNARLHVYGKVGFWYKTFGLCAALTLLIYSIPEMYISLFEPYYVDSVFIFCIVDAVLGFYVLSKLLCIRKINSNNNLERVGEK